MFFLLVMILWLQCTNDTKCEEFKLKKMFDLIILWVQCSTVNSYARSKYINYSENTITTIYIYTFFIKLKSIKMQVIRLYLKFAAVQQIHWIGKEIDSHMTNPHTNQPAGLVDMSSAAQQPTPVQPRSKKWEENERRKQMQAHSCAWRHMWQSRQKFTVNRCRCKRWFLDLVSFFSYFVVNP